MSLRKKGIVATVLTLIAAIVVSLIVSQTILMRRFDELEKRETSQNVDRAVSALYSDFSKINIAWGDEPTASTVIIDDNQTYLALSIDQTTFRTLGLNYILFVTARPGSDWLRVQSGGRNHADRTAGSEKPACTRQPTYAVGRR